MKQYMRKSDSIRWALAAFLLWFVYHETGIATLCLGFLVFFESELRTIKDRADADKDAAVTGVLQKLTGWRDIT